MLPPDLPAMPSIRLILAAVAAYFIATAALADAQVDIQQLRVKAAAGDRAAQFSLGTAYDSGYGVKADQMQAAVWFEKAARQGHVDAQFNLGVLYDEGAGVRQDARQALYWYKRAADKGMAEASNNLGLLYARGEGVPQDLPLALKYFRQAADDKFADALYNLGLMYQQGFGVQKNPGRAYALFAQARLFHEAAAMAYHALAQQLTAEERNAALAGLR